MKDVVEEMAKSRQLRSSFRMLEISHLKSEHLSRRSLGLLSQPLRLLRPLLFFFLSPLLPISNDFLFSNSPLLLRLLHSQRPLLFLRNLRRLARSMYDGILLWFSNFVLHGLLGVWFVVSLCCLSVWWLANFFVCCFWPAHLLRRLETLSCRSCLCLRLWLLILWDLFGDWQPLEFVFIESMAECC
jgi:hypothetical protein